MPFQKCHRDLPGQEDGMRGQRKVATPKCPHRPFEPPNTQEAFSNKVAGTPWPVPRKALPPWPVHQQTFGGSHRDGKLAQVRESYPSGRHHRNCPDLIQMYAWAQNRVLNCTGKQHRRPYQASLWGFQEPSSMLQGGLSKRPLPKASLTGRATRQGLAD